MVVTHLEAKPNRSQKIIDKVEIRHDFQEFLGIS